MIGSTLLTLTQSLQLVALAPCLMVIFFLAARVKDRSSVIIPIMYFTALCLGMIRVVVPAFTDIEINEIGKTILLSGESFVSALSFLLILQFLTNGLPSFVYWMILAVPAIAASPFIYSAVFTTELCMPFAMDVCFPSEKALYLNNVIISAFIFILLIVIVSRKVEEFSEEHHAVKKDHYWLIMSLIIYNIVFLVMDLSYVAGSITYEKYQFGRAMVKIAFVYMVLTSIFRVFTNIFDVSYSKQEKKFTAYDESVSQRILDKLENSKVYRDLGFNRESFAKILGIKEHNLSKIINMKFGKSFSELANDYRIKEAKQRLEKTTDPITTISFDVGFSSITSFNRVFKDLTGKAPSEYREQARQNGASEAT